MGKKIVCGPENVAQFNALLREHAPAFHALGKQLHASGLLSGLSGATLETAQIDADEAEAPAINANVCADCRHWQRDQVGDGTGVGACLIGALKTRLKWPNQNACIKFEGE